MKRFLTMSVAFAALAAFAFPTAAIADQEIALCQAVPVSTPGISALGQRIPAASDISVCVASDTIAQAVPVVVDQPECGDPCFTIEIDGLKVSEDVRVSVHFKLDGRSYEIKHGTGTIAIDPAAGSLCVIGVGTPDPCTDRVTTPRNLTAAAKTRPSGSRVDLAWTASRATRKATVAGYQVWRSLTGQPGTFEQIGVSTVTSFADSTVARGQTYWYYVVAWDDGGRYSPASNTASTTVR